MRWHAICKQVGYGDKPPPPTMVSIKTPNKMSKNKSIIYAIKLKTRCLHKYALYKVFDDKLRGNDSTKFVFADISDK